MSKKGKRKEVKKKKKRNLGRCSFKGIPQWEVGLRSRESAHRNSGQWNYAVFSPALSFSSSDQPRETDSPFPRRRIYQWKTTFPVDTATKSTLFAKRSTKLDAKLRYETRFDRKSTLVRVICHHYTDLDASDQRFLFFSNPCLLFKRISDIYIYSNFESIPVLSPEKILSTTSLSSMRIHFSDKFSRWPISQENIHWLVVSSWWKTNGWIGGGTRWRL